MRIQIVFRDDQDQDLIEWYQNARKGDRGVLIREAIRKYLAEQKTPVKSNTEAKKVSTKALDSLKGW